MSYNILITDSEPNLLKLYQMVLCEAGYQVHPARNAQELLKHLESTSVDLIVIGLWIEYSFDPDPLNPLNPLNPLKLIKLIKQSYPKLPILINSGHSLREDDPLMQLADGYVLKSGDMNPLLAKVDRLLRYRRNQL